MDYMLRGNDKDIVNMFREQRIRTNKRTIQLIPISECGLVTEENTRKTLEYVLVEKNEEIGRSTVSTAEKDKAIVELTEERKIMRTRIAGLEVQVSSDEEDLPVTDLKDLQEEDAKEVTVTDDEAVSVENEKKTGKGKTFK